MHGLSKTQRRAISLIGLPLSGVGSLGAAALGCSHDPVGSLICGFVSVVMAVCSALPDIIDARKDAYSKREPIRHWTILIKAGIKQGIDVRELMRLLRELQRGDAALSALLPGQRTSSESGSALAVMPGGQEPGAAEGTRPPEG